MKKLTVSYTKTMQIRQYEPVAIGMSIEFETDKDTTLNLSEEYKNLKEMVDDKFLEILEDQEQREERIRKKRGVTLQDIRKTY